MCKNGWAAKWDTGRSSAVMKNGVNQVEHDENKMDYWKRSEWKKKFRNIE